MNRRFLYAAFFFLVLLAPAAADDWPQWRGPKRDSVSREKGLLQAWPQGGPKLLWKATKLGDGPSYSTPAVSGGRIYLLAMQGNEEVAIALEEKDGSRLWAKRVGGVGKNPASNNWPGPRSTPTIDGDALYALSSDGDLTCLGLARGELRWTRNLRKQFGGSSGKWAYAESPLIDGELLICTPGGSTATLMALRKTDGAVVWKAKVPGGDAAGYASVVIGEVGGVRMYIQLLSNGVVGVEAKTGKFLWRSTKGTNKVANIPTAVFHDNRVFVSTGYGGGAALAKLTAAGSGVSATNVWASKQMANQIGGVVVLGEHLYGTNGQALLCLEFATGKAKWAMRAAGQGSLCYADGCLYVRGEKSNEVVLVEANPTAYVEKGRFSQPERSSKPAWPYPVVANGRLYLRDQSVLLCYDVKRSQ